MTTIAARFVLVAFSLATSVYCLLVYVPFSNVQFIQGELVPGLALFARWHPYLYWAAFAAGAASVLPDLKRNSVAPLVKSFFAAGAIAGVLLVWHPVLKDAQSTIWTLLIALAALVPIYWLAIIDHVAMRDLIVWGDLLDDRRTFFNALASAPYVAAVYAAVAFVRMMREGSGPMPPSELALGWSWSLTLHVVFFVAVFAVLDLLRAVSRACARGTFAEFWLFQALLAAGATAALYKIGLAAISFTGAMGVVTAAALASAVVFASSALALRLHPLGGTADSGLAVFFRLLAPDRARSGGGRFLWLAAIAALALCLALQLAPMDWNYLLQKMSVLLVWLMTFAALYARSLANSRSRPSPVVISKAVVDDSSLADFADAPGAPPRPVTVFCKGPGAQTVPVAFFAIALVPLAGFYGLDAFRSRLPFVLGNPELNVVTALERYAGYDTSFKLLYEAVAAPSAVEEDEGFYDLLLRNTNLAQDAPVKPTDVNLVDRLEAAGGETPDIYIVVIDSLRRDYLSPYNPKVTFTPAIDRFAGESRVFMNAFTHYGATGLSEPSIWTGGMLVHKQYVTPFHPMNTLAKLLDAEHYKRFISNDPILRVVVPPSKDTVELDANVSNKDYDLCRSLGELQEQVGAAPAGHPLFAYTQPQNIHVSRITREGATVPAGESYPGFYAPYASRLRRMDQCFGQFIQYLKDRGRYDRSIVIFTADHGDSLGEAGRWGHAYTLFPEIVRIPLIVHLPPALSEKWGFNPSTLAFSSDITPTLYALTGHPPTATSPVMGRPFFSAAGRQAAAPPPARDWQMLASSYGPVYGILRNNGRHLYIVDGVNYRDYYYDLQDDPAGEHNLVTNEVRAEHQKLIRDGIGEINAFYRMPDSDTH